MRYTKRKKENHAGRTVISILFLLVLLAAAGGLVYLRWERPPEIEVLSAEAAEPEPIPAPTEEPVEATPAPTPEPTPTPEPLPDGTPLDVSGQPTVLERKDGVYTILIVGVDQISESTDTMMVCRFDTNSHKIDCVNIPRDTLINVAWDLRKLNSVYSASLHAGGTGIDSLCMH
ncbi:MAG: LCP family protein, partial [Oscillospiraceae bacterium]|nr:LCP family protein [Oscillospiraceae bacterium]